MATCIWAIGAKGRCKATGSTPTACTARILETGKPGRRVLIALLADACCVAFPIRASSRCLLGARDRAATSTNRAALALEGRYEGGYFHGQRQGSGVYRYAGKGGGVYLGEWLNGQMDGHGMMMYPDGEFYVGTWRRDKKEGLGVCSLPSPAPLGGGAMGEKHTRWGWGGAVRQVYIWGHSAGGASGDRYEGHFLDGLSHGLGRTVFSAGGSHRVRPTPLHFSESPTGSSLILLPRPLSS
jgi:hypothetical protein